MEKKDIIVDVCVIPPLPETMEGFAKPDGDFALYNRLYGHGRTDLLNQLQADPAGFLLGLMDEAGVTVAVLPAEDAQTTMGLRTPNEKVAALAARAPGRLLAMAAVDPHRGMRALRDLEYAYRELGMRSLCLEPWLHKLRSNDKLYYPIYAKCVELDLPVWIHTSINFVPHLALDFGRPIYLDEVAGHFPELKIIAGHGGWPWVNEMMAILWRHDNVYTDVSAIRPRYLGEPGTGWETLMRYGNSLLQDKILFGTAWPSRPFKESIEEIRALPLKEEVKRKWLGGNAARLFKLE
ncbi:MAG: amidohydrolase family protein [Thermodesulfobacteriota bacterium]